VVLHGSGDVDANLVSATQNSVTLIVFDLAIVAGKTSVTRSLRQGETSGRAKKMGGGSNPSTILLVPV
jgi:hypothetical protein